MPPIRTKKKNTTTSTSTSIRTKRLSAYGFTRLPEADETSGAADASNNAPQPAAAATQLQQQVQEPLAPTTNPKPVKSARLLPPAPKGVTKAVFEDSRRDWDGKFHKQAGTATKGLKFGYSFKLTDQHINDILALGVKVCAGLTEFKVVYADVSYSAHNGAADLTDTSLTSLSHRCPKLKKLYLPGTFGLGDASFLSFLSHCPDLTHLEITNASRTGGSYITGAAFEAFEAHPEWAPKLKTLSLDDRSGNRGFMKAMRELGRRGPELTIELVSTSEVKKWGDWELEVSCVAYKSGRKWNEEWEEVEWEEAEERVWILI